MNYGSANIRTSVSLRAAGEFRTRYEARGDAPCTDNSGKYTGCVGKLCDYRNASGELACILGKRPVPVEVKPVRERAEMRAVCTDCGEPLETPPELRAGRHTGCTIRCGWCTERFHPWGKRRYCSEQCCYQAMLHRRKLRGGSRTSYERQEATNGA